MSTFLHVFSFPFWFFALTFLGAALTNGLTLHFGSFRRKATRNERIGAAVIGTILIIIAFLMTRA